MFALYSRYYIKRNFCTTNIAIVYPLNKLFKIKLYACLGICMYVHWSVMHLSIVFSNFSHGVSKFVMNNCGTTFKINYNITPTIAIIEYWRYLLFFNFIF